MNERQAFTAIRNMLRLERKAAGAVQKVTPEIRRAFEFLRLQIEEMPTGQLEREMWFKGVRQQFNSAFRDANARLYQEVQQALEDNVVDQYNWGEKYLRDGGVSVSPPVGEGPVGFSAQTQVPTRTQLQAITENTEVLGKRLDQLFGAGPSGASPWTAAQVERIDRVVKQGFLLSETNEEIARNLSGALNQSLAESRAIARTAVMDMSQRAHNAFWDANDSVIAGWEFDASMDYRVCPQCAPNDGRTAKKRHELPQTPVHPNCRCMVLPLTETELALREKEGPQRRSVVELVEVKGKADGADKARAIKEARLLHKGTEARAYAKPVRVNGKKYWRVAVDVERGKRPLTMGEFLADATPATRANVLGSKKQADRFMAMISDKGKAKAAMSPDAALVEVTKGQRAPFKKGTRSALESPAVRKIRKSSPPAAPASKVASAPAIRELSVDSPAVSTWMKDSGGSGRLVDDALTRMGKEGGLIGEHAKQLRQFTEQNRVMSHYSMREQIGDYSATYGKQIDSIIASQKRTVETMLKTATPQKIQDQARALLDDLQAPGERRELALKSLFGKLDGCGGYTRPTTGAVNVYLKSESKPLGQLGMAQIKRLHEDNLLNAVAVANDQQVPLPYLTSSGVNKKADWLTIHVHEMGHQVHFKGLGGAAYGGKHKAKGGIAGVSQYGLTNEYERFAEAYSQYVFNPEGLKKHAPGLYSWVEEAVTNALKL